MTLFHSQSSSKCLKSTFNHHGTFEDNLLDINFSKHAVQFFKLQELVWVNALMYKINKNTEPLCTVLYINTLFFTFATSQYSIWSSFVTTCVLSIHSSSSSSFWISSHGLVAASQSEGECEGVLKNLWTCTCATDNSGYHLEKWISFITVIWRMSSLSIQNFKRIILLERITFLGSKKDLICLYTKPIRAQRHTLIFYPGDHHTLLLVTL